MTHVKRGIFHGNSLSIQQPGRKTFQDLDAALEFVKITSRNSSESFGVSVIKLSNQEMEIEVNALPENKVEEKKSLKTRIVIPAGLYDLSW